MESKDDHEAGEVKVGKRWEFPVAQTPLGMLWGTVEESRGGKRILAFRGIKYVEPPVGDLRSADSHKFIFLKDILIQIQGSSAGVQVGRNS